MLRDAWRSSHGQSSNSTKPPHDVEKFIRIPFPVVRASALSLARDHDYPEAQVRLLYRGSERLEIDGIRCLPCSFFLENLRPGEDLP